MSNLDKSFNQVVFFVVISIFLSFSSNLVRKDSIPLLAKKLEITEDIDLDSDKSTLTAISLEKAKEFFENGALFIDARDEVYYNCLLYTSPSPRDRQKSRMPSSA